MSDEEILNVTLYLDRITEAKKQAIRDTELRILSDLSKYDMQAINVRGKKNQIEEIQKNSWILMIENISRIG